MLTRRAFTKCSALLAAAAAVLAPRPARATGPLEYPDNGAAAFGRGGAWVATATDPLAAHYNPAALAIQESGMSMDLNMPYNNVCFVRTNPGNAPTGPTQGTTADLSRGVVYKKVCNDTTTMPKIFPSLGIVARVSDKLGLGFALVPPNAYNGSPGEFPAITTVHNNFSGKDQLGPAPYRYMTIGNQSTILHMTFSAGYELARNFRVGAGFIWSFGVIDVTSMSMTSPNLNNIGDDASKDVKAHLRTADLFVPGVVLGAHWSVAQNLDVGLWGRWVDAIDTSTGTVESTSPYYDSRVGIDYSRPAPICTEPVKASCVNSAAISTFGGPGTEDAFQKFRFLATPPEARIGVRWHEPRPGKQKLPGAREVRDPLADDFYDIELDGSYTKNSDSDLIEIRFKSLNGKGVYPVPPTGANLPPTADRPTGYKDSYGVRLGGQWNVIKERLGLRAGTWIETKAVTDDGWLNVSPVPGLRGGYGGGIVFRHGQLDVSIGYQHHWNQGLNNNGNGLLHGGAAVVGNPPPDFNTNDSCTVQTPTCVPADRDFRTPQAVNGGRVSQSANAFNVGMVYRF